MSLLFGKLWKGGAAPQPILRPQAPEDKTQSALFQWIIPLGILIMTAGISETATDVDSYIGGGFLGAAAIVFYLVKFRSRLNVAGWIISILAMLAGVSIMVEGMSYPGY